jgi:hypothetical protein
VQSLTEGIGHDDEVGEEEEEGGGQRGAKRKREAGSFFSWFEEALSRELDLEIAEVIKDHIWPNPLDFFKFEVRAAAWPCHAL